MTRRQERAAKRANRAGEALGKTLRETWACEDGSPSASVLAAAIAGVYVGADLGSEEAAVVLAICSHELARAAGDPRLPERARKTVDRHLVTNGAPR